MQGIPETRASLLIRLRQPGNQEAWREFASLYEPLIYRLAARKGFQHADAQDLLQDVLVAIARGIDRLEIGEDKGRFRGWLFRISRNLIVNALEKRQRLVVGSGDSDICERLAQEPELDDQAQTAYILEFRRELFHWAARNVRAEFQPTSGREIPRVGSLSPAWEIAPVADCRQSLPPADPIHYSSILSTYARYLLRHLRY